MLSPFLVGGVWLVLGVGGVFSLQYGVLWVACLLVGVSCGLGVSLVILLWGGF